MCHYLNSASHRLTIVYSGCQFPQLPSQTGTISFILLNVLSLVKILLLLYKNKVNSTENRTRIIYAYVTIRFVSGCQCALWIWLPQTVFDHFIILTN